METQILEMIGKPGSTVRGTTYRVVEDDRGSRFLYLTRLSMKLEEEVLIGIVDRVNKRGLVANAYSLTGKPLKFVIDRQYFDFIEN